MSVGPFNPEAIGAYTVSYSEISAARHCLLKWKLSYIERFSRGIVVGPRALGTAWHEIMADHFRALKQVQQEYAALDMAPSVGSRWTYTEANAQAVSGAAMEAIGRVADDSEQADLLLWMYQNFRAVWGLTPDWTVLATEFGTTGWLPNEDGSPSAFQCKVFVDLVVYDQIRDGVVIIDHKSGKRAPTGNLQDMNDQFGLYTWVLRQLGRNVIGSMMIWTRTQRTVKPKPARECTMGVRTERTEAELDELARDAVRMMTVAYSLLGSGVEPPSSPDPELCQRLCDYTSAHIASRKGFAELRPYLIDTGFQQLDLSSRQTTVIEPDEDDAYN